jgi:enoyl-CoA hydratase/carnithine racemase
MQHVTTTREGNVFTISMHCGEENRMTVAFCREMIAAFNSIRETLGNGSAGAVIVQGRNPKFWCTGADLNEREVRPHANTEGFYPMIHTILDFPFPTIALINGHTFGGGCVFAMAHDYRIMNGEKGFLRMVCSLLDTAVRSGLTRGKTDELMQPPVDIGLHFPGMGSLLRAKLHPRVARKMLLEAHKFTGKEALEDGIVDLIAEPSALRRTAHDLARRVAPRAAAGVYGVLRSELYGEADREFQLISLVYSRPTSRQPKINL